jgi:hypothetical protein
MAWNEKYWDVINRCYWNPTYIGLKSIPQKHWLQRDDLVCVPQGLVNQDGPFYVRKSKVGENRDRLQLGEEPLNDLFNLTFAIAADAIVSKLLFNNIGISDPGPFESLGSEMGKRFGWGESNITQPDGFFTSANSLLGVELKVKSMYWDRSRARLALGEGFPFLLFRLQDGFTVPPWLTFPEAPL